MNGSDSILKVTNATTGADQGTVAGLGSIFGANREAHVDLSGAFGSVAIGNNYTPLFLQAVAPFDVNGSTNAVGYTVSNNTTFNATNSIAYTLPSLVDGLTAQIAINKAGASNVSTGNSTGYGLSYTTGGLSAGFASETTTAGALSNAYNSVIGTSTTLTSNEGTDLTKTAYGVSYNFGMAKVAFQGLTAKKTADKIETIGYGVSIPFGAITVNLSASNETDTFANVTTKFAGSQLAASYALSKRTSVYFLNGSYKDSGAAAKSAAKQTSMGLTHAF